MAAIATPTRPPAFSQDDLVDTVAGAESLEAALRAVGALLLREGALDGVEWWIPVDGGDSFRLAFSTGDATGARTGVQLGQVGALILAGEPTPELERDITRLRPLLRHRWTEEQLATQATRLARKNEALEDFAALVAHDVKSSLVCALRSDEPREAMTRTLELVDSILEAVRVDQDGHATSVADCVQQALADLGTVDADVVASATCDFPLPSAALRLVLRNLLANALAAGAHRIHVSALAHGERRALVVDDDGIGIGSAGSYVTGAQLGLALCRRLAERFGGTLELKPRAVGGTRAMLVVNGVDG
jgi:signal transduction histidine kinase